MSKPPATRPSPPPPVARPGGGRPPERGGLLWELRRVHRRIVSLEEQVGDLYARAVAAARRSAAAVDAISPAAPGPRPAGGKLDAWAHPAAPGHEFKCAVATPRADGTVAVSLDGARAFLLPPHLGVLWLALAEDTGLSRDQAVGFKSLRDLSVRIGKLTGTRGPSPATINKYICRLRRWLASRGVDPAIVQANRRLGRRLTIRPPGCGER
jgi:hypothetical protein